jgi:hypothetical protein
VEECREALASHGVELPFLQVFNTWQHDATVASVARSPRLAAHAAKLLNVPRVRLYQVTLPLCLERAPLPRRITATRREREIARGQQRFATSLYICFFKKKKCFLLLQSNLLAAPFLLAWRASSAAGVCFSACS